MAHLCSAYLGRKTKGTGIRGDGNVDAAPLPPPPRDDEYGFLPWRLGRGSLPRACVKQTPAATSVHTRQASHPVASTVNRPVYSNLDAPKKQRPKTHNSQRHNAAVPGESRKIQRVKVSDIVKIFCDRPSKNSQRKRCSARRCLSSPASELDSYPKSYKEFADRLESSNLRNPGNIPVLITTDYTPHAQLVRAGVIAVTRGNVVNAIYKSQDWIYVQTPDKHEGYVPYECLDPIGFRRPPSTDFAQQFPDPAPHSAVSLQVDSSDTSGTTGSPFPSPTSTSRSHTTLDDSLFSDHPSTTCPPSDHSRQCASDDSGIQERLSDSRADVNSKTISTCIDIRDLSDLLEDSHIYENLAILEEDSDASNSEEEAPRPTEEGSGRVVRERLTVLFDYVPIHDYDVPVRRQEVVELVHDGGKDWIWVERGDASRGFIPRKYTVNLAACNLDPETRTTYL